MTVKSFLLAAISLSGIQGAFAGPLTANFESAVERGLDLAHVHKAAAGFFTSESMPRDGPYRYRLGSVVLLRTWDGGWCSGTYISRQGHILTAAHCVSESYSNAKKSREKDLILVENPADVVRFDRVRTGLRDGSVRTELLVAGRGYIDVVKIPADISELRKRPELDHRVAAMASGDWAILQTVGVAEAPCAPVADRMPKPGEPLWAAGFPGAVWRRGALGTFGMRLRVTYGENVGDVHPDDSVSYKRRIAEGDLLQANHDGWKGMSGGPVFDTSGLVLAVITAGASTSFTFKKNSSISIPVRKIFSDLRGAGVDPASFFSCR